MSVQWDSFTPLTAILGGVLIGLGVALYWWGNGRIAGISGMLGCLLGTTHERQASLLFLGGLLLSGWLFNGLQSPHFSNGLLQLGSAGLLVGLGTRLANGCTSGHGVCGLARGSWRSAVATACFMASGFVVATLVWD